MNVEMPEKDWKIMRSLKDELLDKMCNQILGELKEVIENPDATAHDRYLKLWKDIERHDKDVGKLFDDLKRSNALMKLNGWYDYGLISIEQLIDFTEDTQNQIRKISGV